MSKWRSDLEKSNQWFVNIVWPEVSEWFADEDAELIPIEGVDRELYNLFDTTAGVDFWIVERGEGMVSLASRVQKLDYTSFTIRYSRGSGAKTEYEKRISQLQSHYELPTYTLQAYIDPTLEVLRNAAMAPTEELYEYIRTAGEPGVDWPLIPSNENERFFPVFWDELDGVIDLTVHDRDRAGLIAEDQASIDAFGTP